MKVKEEGSLIKRFIHYYKPYKLAFFCDMFVSLCLSLIAIAYPIITRLIFNTYVPEKNSRMIIILSLSLFGVYVIRLVLKFLLDYYGHSLGVKMQADMRKDLFSKFEDLPFSYFDENETGALMARLTNDLNDVSELAHHGPENVLISLVTIIGALIYLLTINWILTLIIACCVPFLLFISIFTRQRQLRAFEQSRKDIAYINAHVQNAISGIRITKAFNNKDKEVKMFEMGNGRYKKSRSYAYKTMGIFHSATNFVIDLFNVACIMGGALISIYTEAFDVADYLAFAVSISLFINPLTTLIAFVEQYQDGATGFKRFVEIIDTPSEEEKENVIQDINLKGNIQFKDVSFKYQTSEEVLNNISFEIKEGETIALVGESGGGKTTICHLLPRFYSIHNGEILIDGVNIEDISLHALRKNIGIVQQDVFLFGGTVKDNILYGRLDASDEEVIEAAKKANIYDFIMSLPNGFDTKCGERGVKLSGGQKQRISIARIFLKNPSILILDEATSALDNTTEVLIQESLTELAKGRTCIVVAHRLSTIRNANRIFVINHGEIVESGSHDELIKQNKEYSRLYNLQFRL